MPPHEAHETGKNKRHRKKADSYFADCAVWWGMGWFLVLRLMDGLGKELLRAYWDCCTSLLNVAE
eukprot:5221915-Amphidinium_carterae.1